MAEIIVIAEHRRGELAPATLELITAAAGLTGPLSSSVTVTVIAADPDALLPALSVPGVDELVAIRSPVEPFQPQIYQAAAQRLIDAREAALVLIPHSVDGLGYAPALAANGSVGFSSDVVAIRCEDGQIIATRSAYKEKVHVDLDYPNKATVVLTVRAGSYVPASGNHQPRLSHLDLPEVSRSSEHQAFIEADADGDVDIAQSEFILSIGRAVGEQDNVEQFTALAEAMGAALGCSRPVADSGWLPKSRQVGQSGKTVGNCKLYIAMGISGAVQHLAGMKHVETIIAVNEDPEAAVFSAAKYGVVGDIFEIAEELQTLFEN